jgi:hypothetical protein
MENRYRRMTVRLSHEQFDQLAAIAEYIGMSPAGELAHILDDWLGTHSQTIRAAYDYRAKTVAARIEISSRGQDADDDRESIPF